MARVTKPGGLVSAYAWDVLGGGLPFEPFIAEMRAMGLKPPLPPSFEASRMEALHDLWKGAGLEGIESRQIVVKRTFSDFDDFWATNMLANIGAAVAAMPPADAERLKVQVRARVPADETGRVTHVAHANAIKGRVPNAASS
jgi:hypothetical protein